MSLGPTRDLGPCIVEYNSTDMGAQFGPTSFAFSLESVDVFESLHGRAPVDSIIVGHGPCEIEVPFTRTTLANLATLIPGGSNSGGVSGNVRVYNNMVGTSMYDNAAALVLTPVVAGVKDTSTNPSYALTIPKAYPLPNFKLTYDDTGQRVYLVMFKGFPDQSTKESWYIGAIA